MSTLDNNGTQIGQLVLAEYSSAPVVAHFAAAAKAGLWPSELELVDRYFQPGRVLDLGCGVGRVTIPLSTMGFEVIGVDISPAMIAAARELTATEDLSIQYEVGDALDLQFDGKTFDHVIFSNQGWMQIPGASDRLRVLREIRRVLVDGGLFLFSTHSRPCVLTDTLWAKRWLRWHGRPLLGLHRRGIDFGDLFYVRRDVGASLEQFLHIPKRDHIQKLLQAEGFQLLGTLREQTIKHQPVVYVARKRRDL
ncbi:MAG: class I SAM-dependent methyltransferase [Acidobacteriota bacterium]